jgi:uncharacterized protein (DUF1810 family)
METARLEEFVRVQDAVYDRVLRELKEGRKTTHWMWFIFPQLSGLGSSSMARKFAIASRAEAKGYLEHPVLGFRLRECTRLVVATPTHNIGAVLGHPDDLKFRSCMTLFDAVAPDEPIFRQALEKFFQGEPDPLTVELLTGA